MDCGCYNNGEVAGFQNFAKAFSMPPEFGHIEIKSNASESLDLSSAIDNKMESIYSSAAEKRGITVNEVKNEVQDIVDEMREFASRFSGIIEEVRKNSDASSDNITDIVKTLEDGITFIKERRARMAAALCIENHEG